MILIVEQDEFVRKAIEAALKDSALEAQCVAGSAGVRTYITKGSAAKKPKDSRDFFDKPIRIGALLDRVRQHIAQEAEKDAEKIISIGPYFLNSHDNTLQQKKTKEIIRLTEKERHILEILAREEGDCVERKTLLDEVWGYGENIETHTLETHIYRLRQKIERDPAAPEILLTDPQGYHLKS